MTPHWLHQLLTADADKYKISAQNFGQTIRQQYVTWVGVAFPEAVGTLMTQQGHSTNKGTLQPAVKPKDTIKS